jgi:hypothetical protein
MDRQVQQFVTTHVGDLWVDAPIGPLVTLVSESWKTRAASPIETEKEKEFSSAPKDGFVPVLSNSAKRRMRAATRTSRVATYDQHVHVHKALSSSNSVPPGFAKASYVKPINQQTQLKFDHKSLEEWHVLAKRAAPLKIASPARSVSAPFTPTRWEPSSSSTSTKVAVPLTPSKLKVGTSSSKVLHEAPRVGSYKPAPNTPGLAHNASAADKGNVVMVEEAQPPRPHGQLWVDVPEFIPHIFSRAIKACSCGRGVPSSG